MTKSILLFFIFLVILTSLLTVPLIFRPLVVEGQIVNNNNNNSNNSNNNSNSNKNSLMLKILSIPIF